MRFLQYAMERNKIEAEKEKKDMDDADEEDE